MNIRINGKDETVDTTVNLIELVTKKGLCPEKIVIEHNSIIVPKEDWHKTAVNENDAIEIVSFVGGG